MKPWEAEDGETVNEREGEVAVAFVGSVAVI